MADLLERLTAAFPAGPRVLVLNPQHNPTGANWSDSVVRALVRAARETGTALLIDDAYFGLHDPRTPPTSALRIVVDEDDGNIPWLAVRSLGKQFHCNGWGIGAATGRPEVVDGLVNHVLHHRSFAAAIPLQCAMATWLADEASERYLHNVRTDYADKRAYVLGRLRNALGFPEHALFPGECTSYLRVQVPPPFDDGSEQTFRRECLGRTGVLLGDGGTSPPAPGGDTPRSYVRFFLGPQRAVLSDALDRMAGADLHWREGTQP